MFSSFLGVTIALTQQLHRCRYSESPLFHPVTGFGGNGVSGTYTVPNDPLNEIRTNPNSLPLEEMWKGCVQDGPFRDTQFKLNIGPGRMITEHCLVRGMDPRVLPFVTPDKVQLVLDAPTFEQHRLIGETPPSGIHIAGHVLIGGEGLNFFSSPGGEPISSLNRGFKLINLQILCSTCTTLTWTESGGSGRGPTPPPD